MRILAKKKKEKECQTGVDSTLEIIIKMRQKHN